VTPQSIVENFNQRHTSFSLDVGIVHSFGFNRVAFLRQEAKKAAAKKAAMQESAVQESAVQESAAGDGGSTLVSEGAAASGGGGSEAQADAEPESGKRGGGDDALAVSTKRSKKGWKPNYTVILIRGITAESVECVPLVCGGFQAKSERELLIPMNSVRAEVIAMSMYRSVGLKRLLLESSWRSAAWDVPAMALTPTMWKRARGFNVVQVDMLITPLRPARYILPSTGFSDNLTKAVDDVRSVTVVEALGHCMHLSHVSENSRASLVTIQFGEEGSMQKGTAGETWMNFIQECQTITNSMWEQQRDTTTGTDVGGIPSFIVMDKAASVLPSSFEHSTDPLKFNSVGQLMWGSGLLQAAPGVCENDIITREFGPALMKYVQ